MFWSLCMIGDQPMNNSFHLEVEKTPSQRIYQTLEQKYQGYQRRLLIVAHSSFERSYDYLGK